MRFFGGFFLMGVLALRSERRLKGSRIPLFGGEAKLASLVWLLGCGFSIFLPILAIVVGIGVYRGVATPIADIMDAADAVTAGELNVRVDEPKRGPPEFRRLAQSFNRMTEELERLEVQRQNLTADVAHELRTPLHIIQGNLEGILDGVYEPSQEQVQNLVDEIHLLTRLVNDLQTLSLVEAGELPLKYEKVNLAELIHDINTSFSGQMDAAGVKLIIETPAGPLIIEADPERLDQIVSNLILNALRYTQSGGTITLKVEAADQCVRIIIKDNGEGIQPDDMPFIFDRFWKGDRSRSRVDGSGSGLGLAISRKLVESHGGQITVESELGLGTAFTIDLPVDEI